MGEAVSIPRALVLIAHHRERTEGKETQDRRGERCDNGLSIGSDFTRASRCYWRAFLARPATVKSKVSRPKIDCCSPDCSKTAVR